MAAPDAKNAARLKALGETPNIPTSFMPDDASIIDERQAAENAYYTKKVGNTGKTQAQIDALANARATAATIREESKAMTSRVDPATGKVITTPKGTVVGGAPVIGGGNA